MPSSHPQSLLAATPLLAAALLLAPASQAFDTFQVKDIRVEGIQRTEAGTVFSYLPVKVGESLTPDLARNAIQALYATGFFKDVRLAADNDVLIVQVEERPAIAKLEFTGLKEFSKDDIRASLKHLGLTEGRILDKALLDQAAQEMRRQYFNRGYYSTEVTTRLTPLERNRTAITFEVKEGDITRIRNISIIGAQAFKEADLLDLLNLSGPGWMTWWTKSDQYSKQKLNGDLETLRSYYQNQGYLEFRIDSTQVAITPDKRDIYITLNISEGEKYTVSDFRFAGTLPVPEEELRKLVTLKVGEAFSRERLSESVKALSDRLGNDGYAFANINAAPEINKDTRQAAFTFLIDPGRKVYVRRINIAGNNRTRDEVIRREMRQIEGAWYAADKIDRSKIRVDRLGFFSDVNIETPTVPGVPDQVDVNVNVTEQSTGSLMLGAGFSSSEGLVLTGSVSQNNLFGTGNRLSAQINSGSTNKIYSLSFTNPYFTDDGVSLGYDLYQRDFNSSNLATADYTTSTVGAGLRLGMPLTEYDTVNFGASVERYDLTLSAGAGTLATQFVTDNGGTGDFVSTQSLRLEAGWARDSRDSYLYPTKGSYQRAFMEVGTPLGDLNYYKLSYEQQWLKPLSRRVSLSLNGEIGLGGGIGDKGLPFFKNFYAGGIGSVRGFDSGTLSPRDSNGDAIGGTKRLVGNAELLFPFPGTGNDRSLRLSAFVDVGAAMNTYDFNQLRASYGGAFTWYSPVGPIKLSLSRPIRKLEGDAEQSFQFQLGQIF